MADEKTVWRLDDHTPGKHRVLRNYLNAWFPILAKWNSRILFVDGFSGPGQYEGGEDGSPLIAIKTLRDHRAKGAVNEAVFWFIDVDKARCDHLEGLLKDLDAKGDIPKNCKWHVHNGKFDETLTAVLNDADEQKKSLAPSFFMIDPFGVSDPAMDLIARLFKNEKVEVFITFMYEFINRFKERKEFEVLTKLFGTDEWKKAAGIDDGEERKRFLYDVYKAQLKKAGAKYVIEFELRQKNRLKYAIFFATTHLRGIDKMKQAIWKVDPTGEYNFRGGFADQLTLSATIDFEPLKAAITKLLKDKPADAWTTVDELETFVIAETDYHSSQYNRGVLAPLERAGLIEVRRPGGGKTGFKKAEKGTPAATIRWKR